MLRTGSPICVFSFIDDIFYSISRNSLHHYQIRNVTIGTLAGFDYYFQLKKYDKISADVGMQFVDTQWFKYFIGDEYDRFCVDWV